jgi:hypothetical protein
MGISLQSIPHRNVSEFSGKLLVLALSSNDFQALLTDSRFHWQLPTDRGSLDMNLAGYRFTLNDAHEVLIWETNNGFSLFGLDKARMKLVMFRDDQRPFNLVKQ